MIMAKCSLHGNLLTKADPLLSWPGPQRSAARVPAELLPAEEKSRRPARLSAEVRIRPKSEERQSPALGDGWPRGEHCCGPADGRRRPCAPAARTAEGGESQLGLGMPRKQDEL